MQTNASVTYEKILPHFSGEFEQFLSDLGSMVYRRRNDSKPYKTPEKLKMSTEHQRKVIPNLERDALHDVLMMKLVSYYEDKYKLNHEPATRRVPAFTEDDIFTDDKSNKFAAITSPRPVLRGYYQKRITASTPDSVAEVVII
ncbi:hypothetical protein K1T71_005051 [Dendrolimus kikuchii]|uniref:Uncharacterized protein n=1 Tax=Dendrolimus kikuchii TaxID=765133 RepID=A0ACC1D603_9NEOP|nr:hypothetical protein K1T71_005051 [Dendrolimus kikuchii]